MSSLKYLWCTFMSHQFMWLFETHVFFFKYICLPESCALHVVFENVVFNVCFLFFLKGMNCSTFAGYSEEKCKCNRKFGKPQLLWGESFFFFLFFSPHKVHNFLSRSEGLEVDQRTWLTTITLHTFCTTTSLHWSVIVLCKCCSTLMIPVETTFRETFKL